MHAKVVPVLTVLSFALLAVSAVSQTGGGPNPPSRNGPSTHRQPYTAEFKTTLVQTLADGTTITRESTEVTALDSHFRTYTARTELTPPSVRQPRTHFTVHDSGADTETTWDSVARRAQVIQYPAKEQQHGCWRSDSGNISTDYGPEPAPLSAQAKPSAGVEPVPEVQGSAAGPRKPTTEDLGVRTFEGVEAHGSRFTWTYPEGEIGNDRPIVRTIESWIAPSIGQVHFVREDPRTGKSTRDLVKLTLGEPDQSLFQPPADYEVDTEQLHEVPCPAQMSVPR